MCVCRFCCRACLQSGKFQSTAIVRNDISTFYIELLKILKRLQSAFSSTAFDFESDPQEED